MTKKKKVIMIVEKKWLGYVLRNLFAMKGLRVIYSESIFEKISLSDLEAAFARSVILILDAAGKRQRIAGRLLQIKERIPEAEMVCVTVDERSEFRAAFTEAKIRSFIAPQNSLAYVYRKIKRILKR